ncbi:MAG TPA: DUF4123 domain-containing protein, partial [Herpetosiphonaceae bacterium]|nr:DUF4123 domain-containing protein [Herpetosiphonaceae bacterium]
MVLALGDERSVYLYRDTPEQNLDMVAPHLVAIDSTLFDWIVQVLWNEPRGVFVRADADMSALRAHLRKFLTVRSPEGKKWLFRYYDPRVLAASLPTCNDQELDA